MRCYGNLSTIWLLTATVPGAVPRNCANIVGPGSGPVVMGCGGSKGAQVVETTIAREPSPPPSIDLPDVDDNYPPLPPDSVLAKLLPRELYQRLQSQKTERGVSLDSVIQTEVDHPNGGCNVLVPDSQCYSVFSELLIPLTEILHGRGECAIQTCVDPEALSCTPTPTDAHFVSCKISTRRNLQEYPLPSACTRLERREVYDTLIHALTVSQADYQGHSTMLGEMTLQQQRELCSSACQFWDPEAMSTVSSGLTRDWPEARGEWRNTTGTITAQINMQDHLHLQLTYSEVEGGLYQAFNSFLEVITELECSLQYHATAFAHHPTLGHLTACPAYLGACLQVTLQLKYALLTKFVLFGDILEAVGFAGAQWEKGSDHFTIAYSHHFGESEVDFLQSILNKVEELAVIECAYAKDDNVFPLLPASVQKGSGKALANFPAFPDQTTVLARLLDQNTYLRLVTKTTPHGFGLDDALQYGRENPQDQFWFALGDSHTLETFSDIFLPVVRAVHGSSPSCPSSALEGCSPVRLHGAGALGLLSSPGCYIAVRHNLSRFPFPSSGSHSSREAVNNAIHSTLLGFTTSRHTGVQKIPLATFQISPSHPASLSGALSRPPHATLAKDWPAGRNVWVCEELQLLLISNTTEHLTLVFHRPDDDLLGVYQQFCCIYPQLERAFDRLGYHFARIPLYGFMSTRPHDFGLCTSAGVLLHAPALQRSSFEGLTRDGVSAVISGGVVALSSSSLLGDGTVHVVIQRAVNAALRVVELEKMATIEEELPSEEDLALVAHHPDYPDICDGASLLARHLSPLLFARLIDKTTSSGLTLNDVIQVGVDQEGCGTVAGPGIIAGDAECYDVFRELYEPVLLDLHSTCQMEGGGSHAPPPIAAPIAHPTGSGCITQTKAKLHCNIAGFSFPPALSRRQRLEVEEIISDALSNLKGSYYPLSNLPTHIHLEMKRKGFLGSEPAYPFFVSTCILRDWPQSRALWLSDDSAVAAFVNGEDHLCLTAVSEEGNVAAVCNSLQHVFGALLNALASTGHQLARHEQFGLLTSSPANAGSGFHLECTLNLPHLSAHALLSDIVASRHLKLIPESDKKGNLFTVASQQSLGVTQQQIAEEMVKQVAYLHHIETTLEVGACLYGSALVPPHPAGKQIMVVVEDECPDLSQASRPLALALDEDLFWELSVSSSALDATLEDVISVGLQSSAHPVGVVACDADCYSVFSELYRRVLHNIYPGNTLQKEHPRGEIPIPEVLLPPEVSEHITGFKFEYRRNLSAFSFPPRCTRAERAQLEVILKDLLSKQPQLTGAYMSLDHLSSDAEDRAEVKAMTEQPHPATGMTRDWPANRGVFLADGGVAVGVNISDHLEVCLVSSESDLVACHGQVSRLMVDLESQLQQQGHDFAFSSQDGYLTTCPAHSGSGFRVEVSLHLPKLSRHPRLGRILQNLCFFLKSSFLSVNKLTGENESALELCYVPGHGVSEGDTMNNLVFSLEHLCHTEATLQKRKMKWRAVPWIAS